MMTAVLGVGLVTALKIVKINFSAVISPAMIMMVVTAVAGVGHTVVTGPVMALKLQVAVLKIVVVALKIAVTAFMILPRTDLNAVIQRGMSMA